MYRRISATKDCYLTNRIIANTLRTNANVGEAGTIDLFKLVGANKSGSSNLTELSRGLVRFDMNEIKALTASSLNMNASSFKCTLKLFDVYGGQTVPSNFTFVVHPVSRSWNEGIGRDVVTYNDIDSANFVTASYSNGVASAWYHSGANKDGLLGSSDVDIISSGNLSDGLGVVVLVASQSFSAGTEDLSVDVTKIVSATIIGSIPDHGFRIAFTGSEEDDARTRFVKRFASRHAYDRSLRPKLVVEFDDSIRDDQANSFFDMTNTVFLYNYGRSGLDNLTSGSSDTLITGSNSLLLRLITDKSGGQFSHQVSASQHTLGPIFVSGTYSASFTIRSSDADLSPRLALSQSISFTQIWGSIDGTVGYHTKSNFTLRKRDRRDAVRTHKNLIVNVTNGRPAYKGSERVRFRVFVDDRADEDLITASRLPVVRRSAILGEAHFSIRDALSEKTIIPFSTVTNSTRLSSDGDGMYFDVFMSDLDVGRVYEIDVLVKDGEREQIFRGVAHRFRVVS